jgi:predicted RNA-binding Zn ribbon-like protein
LANHLVGGVLVPDAVSGHPALELANTRAGWGAAAPREYLVSYDALAVWAGDTGHLDQLEAGALRRMASSSPRRARQVLTETLALRESLYRVVTCEDPAAAVDDLELVHRVAGRAYRASRLVPRADGRVLPDGGDLAGAGLALPLHRVALAVTRLLGDGDAQHVSACAGRGCGWLFLDRTGRRRWCIMAICGNRAKARAFARRNRTDRTPPGPAE